MVQGVAWGVGRGSNSREAATNAVQHAMSQMGTGRSALAVVICPQEYDAAGVVSSLTRYLGNTPVWGFGTIRPFTSDGEQPRSVVVGLLWGNELRSQVHWLPSFVQDGSETARQLSQFVTAEPFPIKGMLMAVDGTSINSTLVCNSLGSFSFPIAGALASGDYQSGKTYQISGSQSGSGALSAVILGGKFRLGIGIGHGWQDIGLHFNVNRVRDAWIQLLGNETPAEAFSRIFGHPAREWGFPPLNELARLYPLGIEDSKNRLNLLLRSVLHVEVDGSFRMNAPVKEGLLAHIMIGDPKACISAAQQAVKQGLLALGASVRPLLALVFLDLAWSYLFTSQSSQIFDAIRAILGDIPMIGAYTLGQISRPSFNDPPLVYNQNIQVIFLGEEQ